MREILTTEDTQAIINAAETLKKAKIFESGTQRPFAIQKFTLDLATARLEENPFKISAPFTSIFVEDATDSGTEIFLKPNAQDKFQSPIKLRDRDSLTFEYPINEAYIHWDAQTGKEITFVIFVDAKFESGTQISQTSGGVTVSTGSILATDTPITLAATTTTEIAPQNLDRKLTTLQNKTGSILYIGGAGVDNTDGLEVPIDGFIYHRNTAALYGYSVAGGDVKSVTEE